MKQLEPLILVQSTPGTVASIGSKVPTNSNSEMAPLFSFAQEERLDAFLAKLQRAYELNQIGDITTSAVMELYEYKVCCSLHYTPYFKCNIYSTLIVCNMKVSGDEARRTGYAIQFRGSEQPEGTRNF